MLAARVPQVQDRGIAPFAIPGPRDADDSRAASARPGSVTMLSVTNVVAGYGAHDEVLKSVGMTSPSASWWC